MTVPGLNKHGADWLILKKWNQEQIEKAREELETFDVSPSRADQLRGIIYGLKQQIEHAEPTPRPPMKDQNYG